MMTLRGGVRVFGPLRRCNGAGPGGDGFFRGVRGVGRRVPGGEVVPGIVCCRGTRPSQAEKSRPRRKLSIGGAKAWMAGAVIGPIPGIVVSRAASSPDFSQGGVFGSGMKEGPPWVRAVVPRVDRVARREGVPEDRRAG